MDPSYLKGKPMNHAMVRRVVTAVCAAAILALLAGPGHAQFVLYDSFGTGVIDETLWTGASAEGTFNAPTAEYRRLVENASLRLTLVSWGNTSSDSGVVVSRQGLNMKQLGTLGGSGFVNGLSARVTVLDADAQDCPGNSSDVSRARAHLIGWFFNDGAGGPGNATGNILAALHVQKDNDGVNRIEADLYRCPNPDCIGGLLIPLSGNPATFATTWSPNVALNLKLVWDQANGRFKFTVTDPLTLDAEVQIITYAGTVTDAGPPTSFDFKAVRVQNYVENCTAARKMSKMDAVFDNIKVKRVP